MEAAVGMACMSIARYKVNKRRGSRALWAVRKEYNVVKMEFPSAMGKRILNDRIRNSMAIGTLVLGRSFRRRFMAGRSNLYLSLKLSLLGLSPFVDRLYADRSP